MNRKAAIQRESEHDRQTEAEIIRQVCAEWMVEAQKIPKKYSLDYALTRNNLVIAYCETKDRPSWRGYQTYMLSAYKFNRAIELAIAQERPCYFVARLGDSIMWTILDQLPREVIGNTQIGGWGNPRDDDDIEPVVHIPIAYFRALKGSGGEKLPAIDFDKEEAA